MPQRWARRVRAGGRLCLIAVSALLALGASAPADGPAFMVKNINIGPDPHVGSGARRVADIGSAVLFAARDDTNGLQLWRTNGTASGTRRVGDIAVRDLAPWSPLPGVTMDGLYYFAGADGLYRSDSTAAGTRRVADVPAEPVMAVGNTLYLRDFEDKFVDDDHAPFWRLWTSDGTSAGTRLIAEFYNDYSATNFAATDRQLFFFAEEYASGTGNELWASDGTAEGTRLLKDIAPGSASAVKYPAHRWLFPIRDTLFFVADDGNTGLELWRSDGTPAGTVQVRDINPGAADGIALFGSGGEPMFAALGDRLFFAARGSGSGIELWVSDGTPAGTQRVADLGALDLWRDGSAIAVVDGRLFFAAADEGGGRQLWSSDGSAAGTTAVKDLPAGSSVGQLVGLGDALLFVVRQWPGAELWRSDGTAAGTFVVRSFPQGTATLLSTTHGAFLVADDGKIGAEPWVSDGTAAGTVSLGNLRVGEGGSNPHDLTDLDGTLVFAADDGLHGDELWRSDGTAGGTAIVRDIQIGEGASAPSDLVVAAGALYFAADDGPRGRELWRSDGTARGTAIVRDIHAGAAGSSPQQLRAVGSTVYFFADDGVHGVELWRSDGRLAGTRLVKDINPGPSGSFVCNWIECSTIVRSGEFMFFAADDGVHGDELWRTDGTAGGTTLVSDVTPGPVGSFPNHLTDLGDFVVFGVDPYSASPGLWRTDGSREGTLQLASVGIRSRYGPLVVGHELFFYSESQSGLGPSELWRSDGTPAGTFAVPDPNPGVGLLRNAGNTFFDFTVGFGGKVVSNRCGFLGPSFPDDPYWYLNWYLESAAVVADRVLFGGEYRDPLKFQLWTSDGTPAGTHALQEFPESDGYLGIQATASDANVFFTIGQGRANRELWALPLAAVPPVDPHACLLAETTPTFRPLPTPTATTPAVDPSPTPTTAVRRVASTSGCAVSAARSSPGSLLVLALPIVLARCMRRRAGQVVG